MPRPLVSVLMPVYNGARYLREAVDSILDQTYLDFEFIIVDDGSVDDTAAILDSYDDTRIVRLRNETNLGIVPALNRGLSVVRGEYIARMDADDISLPQRLERQIAYMIAHPEVGVVGTWIRLVDVRGQVTGEWTFPVTHGLLRWMLCFGSCLAHPSVMLRASVATSIGGYDESFANSEDRDLWLRASSITRLSNLPEILLLYRRHNDSVTARRRQQERRQTSARLSQRAISGLLGSEVSYAAALALWLGASHDPELISEAAGLIADLARVAQRSLAEDAPQRAYIRRDAARRMARLALHRGMGLRVVPILVRAACLDPRAVAGQLRASLRALRCSAASTTRDAL